MPKVIHDDIFKKDHHDSRPNVFNASELAYTCPFKMFMDRTLGKGFPDEAMWNLYRGKIFDQYLTKLFDEDQVRVQRRVKGTPYVVRGRIDGLNYDENCIYELKTVFSVKWVKQPMKHHVPQGLFYLANYDPEAKLRFIYASMDGCKTFEYTGTLEEMDGEMQLYDEKAKVLGDALKAEEPPEPVKGNECKWCGYKQEGLCAICKPRVPRKKKVNSELVEEKEFKLGGKK